MSTRPLSELWESSTDVTFVLNAREFGLWFMFAKRQADLATSPPDFQDGMIYVLITEECVCGSATAVDSRDRWLVFGEDGLIDLDGSRTTWPDYMLRGREFTAMEVFVHAVSRVPMAREPSRLISRLMLAFDDAQKKQSPCGRWPTYIDINRKVPEDHFRPIVLQSLTNIYTQLGFIYLTFLLKSTAIEYAFKVAAPNDCMQFQKQVLQVLASPFFPDLYRERNPPRGCLLFSVKGMKNTDTTTDWSDADLETTPLDVFYHSARQLADMTNYQFGKFLLIQLRQFQWACETELKKGTSTISRKVKVWNYELGLEPYSVNSADQSWESDSCDSAD